MLELLILWNVAALREEGREDNDFSSGIIAVWIMLQLVTWPLSLIAILRKVGMPWLLSISAASAFTIIGYLIGGENFYLVLGMLSLVAAASVVAYAVVWDA